MDVALVFLRGGYTCGDPPLGILYLASSLAAAGHRVHVLDSTFRGEKQVVRDLERLRPAVAGFYMDCLNFRDAGRICALAKRLGITTIAGGPQASILPLDIIGMDGVDFVMQGEGERSLVTFLDQFRSGQDYSRVRGLVFRSGSRVIADPGREIVKDLDKIPLPAYDKIDFKSYLDSWYHFGYLKDSRGTSVIGSRGCAFNCSFCQPTLDRVFGKVIRRRSPGNIVHELKVLKKRYGINSFHLQDDTATASKHWFISLCSEIRHEKLALKWSCNSRVDTIDKDIIEAMRSAGVREVRLGIEAISDRIRNEVYGKGTSMASIEQAISCLSEGGISPFGYFMIGAPGEEEDEIRKTISYAVASDLSGCTISVATPLPGTYLHQKAGRSREKIFDYYKPTANCASHLPGSRLQALKREGLIRFYLSGKRIKDTLREFMHPGRVMLKLRRL